MYKVENVAKYFNDRPVLSGVSFKIAEGELLGLVGPSGAGKSVLLKLLGKVMLPDTGRIIVLDQEGEEKTNNVGFLFQEGALFDSMSVIENVAFPLLSGGKTGSRDGLDQLTVSYTQAMERSFEILREVGLADACSKMPGQLSGGMRRRVALARALVSRPDLVLLDDPTGGLDPVAASVIMNLIKELHQHYQPTIVMVSHDIRRLLPSVGRVLGLFNGQIICDEATETLAERALPEVVRFLATRYDFSLSPSLGNH